MTTLTVLLFALGYLLISLEHKINLNKAATALFMGVCLWVFIIISGDIASGEVLLPHFESISEILFFLLGAMTIVELIDVYQGFDVIQNWIRSGNGLKLLWMLCLITFFLSAVLDNLTTTIVMVALIRRFMDERRNQWFFAGFVVIAANAGGAWSPIGDVTTIMLWNTGHITTLEVIKATSLPSLAAIAVPLIVVSLSPPAELQISLKPARGSSNPMMHFESRLILFMGIALLLSVPVFKSFTNLPPFMGMLFGLSILWLLTEILQRKKTTELRHKFSVAGTLQRIDTPSVLFFLGILLAVAALEEVGVLDQLGILLNANFSNFYISSALLGLLSAIVDNVPLVAGAMGMYSFDVYPQDHSFWTFIAYCVGTGGSILIIGSAAGVAAMGLLQIDFIWYLKRISLLALVGYLSGIVTYILLL